MTARLATVAPDLVTLIERQSDERQRQVAVAVSSWIVDRVGLADGRVDAALAQLRHPGSGNAPERKAVQHVVDELDAAAWNLHDRVEEGQASYEDYLRAFAHARAAHAVWSASDAGASTAALEATYEAQAATGDLDGVRQLVGSVLS